MFILLHQNKFWLTFQIWDDTISPAWFGQLRAAANRITDMSQRYQTPPSSRGPGRGPLKAQTGVRIPMGAQRKSHRDDGSFHFKLASPQGRCYSNPRGAKKSHQIGDSSFLPRNTLLNEKCLDEGAPEHFSLPSIFISLVMSSRDVPMIRIHFCINLSPTDRNYKMHFTRFIQLVTKFQCAGFSIHNDRDRWAQTIAVT